MLDKNGKYDEQSIVDEGFIKETVTKNGYTKERHVISDDSPDARTAVGITADGHLLMLSIAGKHHLQPSRGVTIKELAGIMKDLGCIQGLNLDGGSSTTMYVRSSPGVSECTIQPGIDVNSNKPERPVKSFLELIYNPAPQPVAKSDKSVTK